MTGDHSFGRIRRYLIIAVLAGAGAACLATWLRSRSRAAAWHSAPTGWSVTESGQ